MADRVMGSLASSENYDDPWARYNQPFGTILGTAPEDTPVVFKTRGGVKITEGDIQRGMDVGMGAATVGGPAKGIKAYHSSPHDFDKFDLSRIGTGEGAQVYGHGLYFAENPAVSGQGGQYWEQFMHRMPKDEQAAAGMLRNEKFDRQKAIEYSDWNLAQLRQGAERGELDPRMMKLYEERQRQHELLLSGAPVGPRTYEVNIKADPAQMLDWDKPIHGQNVYGQLQKIDPTFAKLWPGEAHPPTGEAMYNYLRANRGTVTAADKLREAGIPGIKYLDQGSRVTGPAANHFASNFGSRAEALAAAKKSLEIANGPRDAQKWTDIVADLARPESSNYVVFDPSIIDIMKKYGLAGAAPAGMGALAAQDYYQQER